MTWLGYDRLDREEKQAWDLAAMEQAVAAEDATFRPARLARPSSATASARKCGSSAGRASGRSVVVCAFSSTAHISPQTREALPIFLRLQHLAQAQITDQAQQRIGMQTQ